MLRLRPLIFAAALAVGMSRASACILEFRSTDWQVAQSPLVVVATVAKVSPAALTPDLAPLFANGLTKPSAATVTITQALKGTPPSKTLLISSGPIRSCNPYPVHLSFTPGKSYIFILTPGADGYQLAWAGSLLELSDLPAVQDSIARMNAWRTNYLAGIEKDSPETFRAAKTLDATLAAASAAWPNRSEDSLTPSELLHGISDDPATTKVADAALALLNASTPAAVETALALNFDQSTGWSYHPLWSQIRLRYTDTHATEILALNESEWSRLLAPTTSPEQLDKYFTRVSVEPPTLAFPIPSPDPIANLHGDTLTTDFLLRAQAYDRGELYFNYGMQPDPLSTLNPQRLSVVLPALYNSSDSHLQWAASTAIFEMPSDDFLPLLLPHLIAGDPLPLADLQADSGVEKHLLALLTYADAHASPADLAKIWSRLAATQCFSPSLIQRAKSATPTDAAYRAALAAYLKAAADYQKSNRSPFDSP